MAGHSARIHARVHALPRQQAEVHERRQGPMDRRRSGDDRRNVDRISEDPAPRRNPDITDRRQG